MNSMSSLTEIYTADGFASAVGGTYLRAPNDTDIIQIDLDETGNHMDHLSIDEYAVSFLIQYFRDKIISLE